MSSCGSMPAVGVPVTLRILSAPEPREQRPRVLNLLDHRDGVLRRDLADLQVGAGGDVAVAAAVALGEIREAGHLPMLEDAVGDAQPAHIRRLGRGHVEQTVEAPAEIVGRLGRDVIGGLLLQTPIGVERVLVALELFLVRELAAGLQHAVLGGTMGRVGADRLGRSAAGRDARQSGGAARRAGDLHAGDEAFEIAFLLGVKIAGAGPRAHELEVVGRRVHSARMRLRTVSGAGRPAIRRPQAP